MPSEDKPLVWLHGEVKTPPFSPETRIEAGVLLRQLQQGKSLGLPQSRPMPTCALLENRRTTLEAPMDKKKKAKLEAAGWAVGSTQDFLQLSEAETAFVDFKIAFSEALLNRRTAKKMSQVELAKLLHSSQSRVAKMEHADPTVTLDLLLRSLLALGATRQDLANTLVGAPSVSTRTARA